MLESNVISIFFIFRSDTFCFQANTKIIRRGVFVLWCVVFVVVVVVLVVVLVVVVVVVVVVVDVAAAVVFSRQLLPKMKSPWSRLGAGALGRFENHVRTGTRYGRQKIHRPTRQFYRKMNTIVVRVPIQFFTT